MAFTFNSNPAKESFGKTKKIGYASDYIADKKAKFAYCNGLPIKTRFTINPCDRVPYARSFEALYIFNRGRFIKNERIGRIPFLNKGNLDINLYTKINLKHINVITGTIPVPPNSTGYPTDFSKYRVDPCGELFGNSQCGVGNFADYLQLNTAIICNPPSNIEYAPPDLYPDTLKCNPKNSA